MVGMNKLFEGILKYRKTVRADLVKQFERIRDNPSECRIPLPQVNKIALNVIDRCTPRYIVCTNLYAEDVSKRRYVQPTAVAFSCMDSRMLPTRFLQAQVGDIFFVRNSGNMVPHATSYGVHGAETSVTTEPAGLELACVRAGIKTSVVIGHSDCKAMNLLHNLHMNPGQFNNSSPLDLWLRRHGVWSLDKLERRLKSKDPLKYIPDHPELTFEALIDIDDKFNPTDKLSQINTLQQLENIASHPILHEVLKSRRLQMYALWFDIYTGDVYYFSKKHSTFVAVDETNAAELQKELPQE